MKIRIILADRIDELKDGKHVLTGVYADSTIIGQVPPGFVPSAEVPFGIPISMLINVGGLPVGSYVASIRLKDPSGNYSPQFKDGKATFEIPKEGRSVNLTMVVGSLALFEGVSRLEVSVGDESCEAEIILRTEVVEGAPIEIMDVKPVPLGEKPAS